MHVYTQMHSSKVELTLPHITARQIPKIRRIEPGDHENMTRNHFYNLFLMKLTIHEVMTKCSEIVVNGINQKQIVQTLK